MPCVYVCMYTYVFHYPRLLCVCLVGTLFLACFSRYELFFDAGLFLDVLAPDGLWREAEVIGMKREQQDILVQYCNWKDEDKNNAEWISVCMFSYCCIAIVVSYFILLFLHFH
jgi:hypothetical protein